MKIYYIKRNDPVGYDEYDSAVVEAETPEQALEELKSEHGEDSDTNYTAWGNYDVTITEIVPGEFSIPRIIIESFNAG